EKLGIDPLDLALRNAADPGYISPHGNRVISCELKQCLEKAADLIHWREKRADLSQRHPLPLGESGREGVVPSPRLRGLGLGTTVHVSGKRHFGDYDGG